MDGHRQFVWPHESMRTHGGRLSWNGWFPHAGMVGYVVHIWSSGQQDTSHSSMIDSDLYLVEIGNYYVPITEAGIRLHSEVVENVSVNETNDKNNQELYAYNDNHNQNRIDSDSKIEDNENQYHQHPHHQIFSADDNRMLYEKMYQVCTPSARRQMNIFSPSQGMIAPTLGSGLESPTSSFLAKVVTGKAKIQAVSSSSSEDETELLKLENERHKNFLNMWKQITEQQEQQQKQQQCEEQKKMVKEEEELPSTQNLSLNQNDLSLQKSVKVVTSSDELPEPTTYLHVDENFVSYTVDASSHSLETELSKIPTKTVNSTREVAVQAVSSCDAGDKVTESNSKNEDNTDANVEDFDLVNKDYQTLDTSSLDKVCDEQDTSEV